MIKYVILRDIKIRNKGLPTDELSKAEVFRFSQSKMITHLIKYVRHLALRLEVKKIKYIIIHFTIIHFQPK